MARRVEKIPSTVGKLFIREFHYSHSCHNGPMCWGMFDDGSLVGVIAFATPCSENVRASIFGEDRKDEVTELHRMVILDDQPKGLATWFIARAVRGLREYRPRIRAIISFADSTEGHDGTVYRAANFHYAGTTGRSRFYRDGNGSLRHPRQCGVNITAGMAKDRGWVPEMRDSKFRYIFFVGSGRQKRKLREECLVPLLDWRGRG